MKKQKDAKENREFAGVRGKYCFFILYLGKIK